MKIERCPECRKPLVVRVNKHKIPKCGECGSTLFDKLPDDEREMVELIKQYAPSAIFTYRQRIEFARFLLSKGFTG